MKLSDLSAVNVLASGLRDIQDKLSVAQTVQIFLKGTPIPADLLAQLHTVGDPVVAAYYQSAAATIITQLASYSVSAT